MIKTKLQKPHPKLALWDLVHTEILGGIFHDPLYLEML